MPGKRFAILGFLASFGVARVAVAQVSPYRSLPMPDSAQMSAMMGRVLRRMQPAQFVLDHREELALTPEQVPFLESLILAEADSARVRTGRRRASAMAQMRNTNVAGAASAMSWTGAIDEAAIREMSRQQAEQSAEIQIDLARDRHAVGAVLTPSQLSMLTRIEATDMMPSTGRAVGVISSQAGPSNQPYFEFQVDKQVAQQPGTTGPKYPDELRASNTRGEVLAQFVVDSTGQYRDGSFKVLKTTHSLFTQAVRDALPQMHFIPAEKGGRKVAQLVQVPFTFEPGMK